MPLYDVEHICPLSDSQQDQIAEAITKMHSQKFLTPRLFVNVRFTDVSKQALYVAGKRRANNRIIVVVRHGPSRTQSMYNDASDELVSAWTAAVGSNQGDTELRAVFFLGSMVAASEAGISIPPAGEDKKWLQENMEVFEKKAKEGDEDFKDMVDEVKQRGLDK